jgi:Domain of unknown function (DUF5666)
MLSKRIVPLLAIAAMALGVLAIPAQAAIRHIDGTVVSKDSDSRSFRIETQSGNQIRIKVNASTRFQRIGGFGGLHKGLAIEVEAKRSSNGLVATHIETRGGGGGADDNGGGSDDGPNHT